MTLRRRKSHAVEIKLMPRRPNEFDAEAKKLVQRRPIRVWRPSEHQETMFSLRGRDKFYVDVTKSCVETKSARRRFPSLILPAAGTPASRRLSRRRGDQVDIEEKLLPRRQNKFHIQENMSAHS